MVHFDMDAFRTMVNDALTDIEAVISDRNAQAQHFYNLLTQAQQRLEILQDVDNKLHTTRRFLAISRKQVLNLKKQQAERTSRVSKKR